MLRPSSSWKCFICVGPTEEGQTGARCISQHGKWYDWDAVVLLPAFPDVSMPKSHPAMLTPAYATLLEAGAAAVVLVGLMDVLAGLAVVVAVVLAGLVVVDVTRVEDFAVVVGLARG